MLADVPTMDSLGKRYAEFDGWGMASEEMEVLLVLVGLMWKEVQKPSCQHVCQHQGR